jgi:hypothetical protein
VAQLSSLNPGPSALHPGGDGERFTQSPALPVSPVTATATPGVTFHQHPGGIGKRSDMARRAIKGTVIYNGLKRLQPPAD